MATTNPVFQVLVTSGNADPLAKNARVDTLAVGQIGVFNYHTGLSVDATSAASEMRDVFIAVGIDPLGVGSLQDINKSAGQLIQVRNLKSATVKPVVAALPKIIDITAFTAKCETDYPIKIEFRNQKIYGQYGYNQFTKTFTYFTSCCADACDTCGDGNCNELAQGLVNEINNDTDGLVIAELLDYTTVGTGVDAIVITDYAAWVADVANAGKCLGIRLTSVPESLSNYCSINLKYYNPRGTDMIVSTGDTFTCNGSVDTYQELVYSQGSGYNVRQLEYLAGGWNGKPGPYRVSALTGTAREGFAYFASATATYRLIDLTYDQFSVGGWLEYLNNLNTLIAIPTADTNTNTKLIAILNVVFPQFLLATTDTIQSLA